MTDDQSTYLCNDDDLNSLTDYFTAALAGEESKSRLQQMWEQEIGIVKATRAATKKQSGPYRFKDEEPDLTSISNCIKKEPIVITPEICTLFWNYRADSGHLYHLLFDLVGEEFVTSHELWESISRVLDEWQTPEEKQAHDNKIRKDEQKRLLRLIKEWQRKHCYWFRLPHTDGEQRYHFDPAAFKEFLESLVATDPVPGSKKDGEQKYD